MATARQRSEWNRTSAIMAIVHNAHLAEGTPAKPSDFNPFAQDTEDTITIGRDDARNLFRTMANSARKR